MPASITGKSACTAGATATLAGGIDHPPPGAAAFDFQYIAPPANAAATARATTAPALLLAFMIRSLFYLNKNFLG
jgi:hypothetical protein